MTTRRTPCSIAIAAAAALGMSLPALAQVVPGAPGSSSQTPGQSSSQADAGYSKLDKNRDGSISKREAVSNKELIQRWSELDVDKNGKLDQGEFARFEAGAAPQSSPAPSAPAEDPKSGSQPSTMP